VHHTGGRELNKGHRPRHRKPMTGLCFLCLGGKRRHKRHPYTTSAERKSKAVTQEAGVYFSLEREDFGLSYQLTGKKAYTHFIGTPGFEPGRAIIRPF